MHSFLIAVVVAVASGVAGYAFRGKEVRALRAAKTYLELKLAGVIKKV